MGDQQSDEAEYIILKILGHGDSIIEFKLKRHTPFRRYLTTYCERCGMSMEFIQFRYDGNPLNIDDTPLMLNMVEGDTISVIYKRSDEFS